MKNIDFVIKKVAEKNGMDVKLVDKVVKHHWKNDIRKELFSHEHTAVYLRYIGTIIFSLQKTRKGILKIISAIRKIEENIRWKPEKRDKQIVLHKEKIRKFLVQHNLLAIKFNKKGELIKNKRISKALASSTEEPGGCD